MKCPQLNSESYCNTVYNSFGREFTELTACSLFRSKILLSKRPVLLDFRKHYGKQIVIKFRVAETCQNTSSFFSFKQRLFYLTKKYFAYLNNRLTTFCQTIMRTHHHRLICKYMYICISIYIYIYVYVYK